MGIFTLSEAGMDKKLKLLLALGGVAWLALGFVCATVVNVMAKFAEYIVGVLA
jgi:hypothetical protein